ncbi:dnaJ homolog subfamily C member 17-like isoform X2 [Patiria miniata]|uniref:DnaJ homolog subfamily C member 17 n=1 Tax=Patiria miniata TaxID=46514 RepID=A0A913YXY9_PATMI|nr:dnaJ homolog subfamily C member 17-like isoform X2 [Patiria miniata]
MAPGLSEKDLYEVLGVLQDATVPEIKKAYRKKALTCHPDKNPDNPRAAKEWEELSKALEILTDSEARAAYDKVLKAKKATELRNRALESKRRKVKEDLEAREAAFRDEQDRTKGKDAAQQLQEVIKRLQEEGSRILAEEQRLLKEELQREDSQAHQGEDDPPRLKVKWKSKKSDETNGGYNYDVLYRTFQKYGSITNLLVSSKKRGSAVVEFGTSRAAELAVRNELGLSSNPLELSWLSGQPQPSAVASGSSTQPTPTTDADFESMVLQRLKNARQPKKATPQHAEEERNVEQSTVQDGRHTDASAAEEQHLRNTEDDLRTAEDLRSSVGGVKRVCPEDDSVPTEGQADTGRSTFVTSNTGGAQAKDYESLESMRMRQNAERQRLIEQMAKEDAEES